MTTTLTIGREELAEVRAILTRILPAGVCVFVFGSRAGGAVKPWSDLDLAFESDHGLSRRILGELADAFDESRLPWRVDLVDRATVSADFGRIIDQTKVPLE